MSPVLEQLDQVILFRQTLSAETDRGVALVCASYLDVELRTMLEKTFVNVPGVVSKLFDGTGPLATFSSRIDLAFSIGLLSAQTHRALHLIRKIRNDFAHTHSERSFLDQEISSRCLELMPINPFLDEKDPRKLYIRGVLSVLAIVHAKTALAQHMDPPAEKSFDKLRNSFEDVRDTVNLLVANLTEAEMLRLSNPETIVAEKKRLILEASTRIGIPDIDTKLG